MQAIDPRLFPPDPDANPSDLGYRPQQPPAPPGGAIQPWAFQPYQITPPAPPAPPGYSFLHDVGAGAAGLGQQVSSIGASFGVPGAQTAADKLGVIAKSQADQAHAVDDFSKVHGLGDAWRYGEHFVAQNVAPLVAVGGALATLPDWLPPVAVTAVGAGLWGALGYGQAESEMYNQTGKYNVGAGMAAAIPSGLLMAKFGSGKVLQNVILGKPVDAALAQEGTSLLSRTLARPSVAGALMTGGEQAGVSLATNALLNTALAANNPNFNPLSPDAIHEYINSAIAGGVMGGLMGGVHGAFARGPKQPAPAPAPAPSAEASSPITSSPPPMGTQDWINQNLGIGRKPGESRADVKAAFPPIPPKTPLDIPVWVVGKDNKPFLAKTYGDLDKINYAYQNPTDTTYPLDQTFSHLPDEQLDKIRTSLAAKLNTEEAPSLQNQLLVDSLDRELMARAQARHEEIPPELKTEVAPETAPETAPEATPTGPQVIAEDLGGDLNRSYAWVRGLVGKTPDDLAKEIESGVTTYTDSRGATRTKTLTDDNKGILRAMQEKLQGKVEATPEAVPEKAPWEMSYDELDAAINAAKAHNDALDLAVIKKYMGEDAASRYAKLNSRQKDKFWNTEAPAEADLEANGKDSAAKDIDTLREYQKAVNNFDAESPQALGRSIVIAAKTAMETPDRWTPERVTVTNALKYANDRGWNLSDVRRGMADRAEEWAGSDAQELFGNMFKQEQNKSQAKGLDERNAKPQPQKLITEAVPETAPVDENAELKTRINRLMRDPDLGAEARELSARLKDPNDLDAVQDAKDFADTNERELKAEALKEATSKLYTKQPATKAEEDDALRYSVTNTGNTLQDALRGSKYTSTAFERLPNKAIYSKEELQHEINRPDVTKAEKETMKAVLDALPGEKVTAKDLVDQFKLQTGNFELTPKDTTTYADEGLERIGRESIGRTTEYELPFEVGISKHELFDSSRMFGWVRSFIEDGVRHVVEIQSDLAQDTKNATKVSPMLKGWERRLVREELVRAAKNGEKVVDFATPDTVAKVEGWPERDRTPIDYTPIPRDEWTPQEILDAERIAKQRFQSPDHQSIYDRYKREVVPFLKSVGGKEITDAQGHTWIEVPTKEIGQRIRMFGGSQWIGVQRKNEGYLKYSTTKPAPNSPAQGTRADEVTNILKSSFTSPHFFDRAVQVVNSVDEIPKDVTDRAPSLMNGVPKAFYDPKTGKIWMIADNIARGEEMSTLLHESVHEGMKSFLGQNKYNSLIGQLRDWVANGTGLEGEIADRAFQRLVAHATGREEGMSPALKDEELAAYFVEEAVKSGIDPTIATPATPLGRWMSNLWNAVKSFVQKRLGIDPAKLTAKDVVNMAYGAAKINMERPEAMPQSAEEMKYSVASESADTDPAVKENIAKQPEFLKDPAHYIATWFHAVGHNTLGMVFGVDLKGMGPKAGIESAPRWYKLNEDKMIAFNRMVDPVKQHLNRYFAFDAKGRSEIDSVVDHMDKNKVWGYKPDFMKDNAFTPDSEAVRLYNKLTPEQQAEVREEFATGRRFLTKMREVTLGGAKRAYEEAMAAAKGDTALEARAEKNYARAKRTVDAAFGGNADLPYSPMTRKGTHFLVMNSKEYNEATPEDQEKMQSNPKHRIVQMGSEADMTWLAKQYKDDPNFGDAAGGTRPVMEKEKFVRSTQLAFQQVDALRSAIDAESDEVIPPKLKSLIKDSLNDIWVRSLADTSSRVSGLKRKETPGYRLDRIAAAYKHYEGMSHLIASMEYNKPLEEVLNQIRSEGDVDPKARRFANEILFRHALGLVHVDNSIMGKTMKVIAANRIVTSPAFYVQQLSEPWMVMLPMLASRHGYFKAARMLWGTMHEAAKMMDPKNPIASIFTHDGNLELSNFVEVADGEKAFLQRLLGTGLLNLTQLKDLGAMYGGNPVSVNMQKWFSRVNQIATNSETLNRIMSAQSAYRLEYEKALGDQLKTGVSVKQAKANAREIASDQADEIVSRSHGDYEPWAAPRYLMQQYWNNKGIPIPIKLIGQFKKFEVMRTVLLVRQALDAFGDGTPEERRVARAYLKYTFAHYMVAAGLMGIPGYGLTSTLVDWLFGGEGHQVDPDTDTYKNAVSLLGEDMGTLLTKGVPAELLGVDIGKKIGAGSLGTGLFGTLPNIDVTSKGGVQQTVANMMGPAVGLASDTFDALDRLRQGDYQKGMELLEPAFLRNLSMTERMNTQGLTNARNDVLLSPDEMSELDKFIGLAGFDSTKLSLHKMQQSAIYTASDYYNARYERLAHKAAMAMRDNDTDKLAELGKTWTMYQNAQREQGIIPTPLSVMYQARAQQIRREAFTTPGGLQRTRKNIGFVGELENPQ